MVSLFSEDGPFMLHWRDFNVVYTSLRANYNLYLSSFVSHFLVYIAIRRLVLASTFYQRSIECML